MRASLGRNKSDRIMAVTATDNTDFPGVSACDSESKSSRSSIRQSRGTHKRSNMKGANEEFEPLNDLIDTSHHTGRSNSFSSFGESSLSSFLSLLLEEDENSNREISIVIDNPRTEQRNVRDLRETLRLSAIESEKPKCRWDYLTRDNSDRDVVWHTRNRRGNLVARASSFSGAISNTKHKFRTSSNSSTGRPESAANVFLRMPQRRTSPIEGPKRRKKPMVDRFNMSDTNLMDLPLPCAASVHRRRLARGCSNGASTENASWSTQDLRQRRQANSNRFLDTMMEPEGSVGGLQGLSLSPSRSYSMPSLHSNEQDKESKKKVSLSFDSLRGERKEEKKTSFLSPKDKPPTQAARFQSPRTPSRRMKSPPPNRDSLKDCRVYEN